MILFSKQFTKGLLWSLLLCGTYSEATSATTKQEQELLDNTDFNPALLERELGPGGSFVPLCPYYECCQLNEEWCKNCAYVSFLSRKCLRLVNRIKKTCQDCPKDFLSILTNPEGCEYQCGKPTREPTPKPTPQDDTRPPSQPPQGEPTATPKPTPQDDTRPPSQPPQGEPTATPKPTPQDVTKPPTKPPTRPPTIPPTPSPTQDPCSTNNCIRTCFIRPDPHYTTWTNNNYDFQGGCDQIAIDNTNLEVQIRTRPKNYYSTITEVSILFKASGNTFNYRANYPFGSGYTTTNGITGASGVVVSPYGTGHLLTIDAFNFIRITSGWGGITLYVQGSGAYMFGSEGMCGNWNLGSARFQDLSVFDTSGGFWGTAATSIALALDWQVPAGSSLMALGHDSRCDGNNQCGSGYLFDCDEVRRNMRASAEKPPEDCSRTCDMAPQESIKEACEVDVRNTGDNYWACADDVVNPPYLFPDTKEQFIKDCKRFCFGEVESPPKWCDLCELLQV